MGWRNIPRLSQSLQAKILTMSRTGGPRKTVKLLVWDLDDTLWAGTLLEGDDLVLRPRARATLETLSQRGILHSIASKNDRDAAFAKLLELGVDEYFLYPQIGWGSKVASLEKLADVVNVGLDALALIDDQAFVREEVGHALPEVLTLDAFELDGLVKRPEFKPRFITAESARRRQMCLADMKRNEALTRFDGPNEAFLATLGLQFAIGPAGSRDLERAEELTVRSHQLNSSGYIYSREQLAVLQSSADHLLLVSRLRDRFGEHGMIGLAVVEKLPKSWNVKLILTSCRVMDRGVGTVLLNCILDLARRAGVRLFAEFRDNGRNVLARRFFDILGFREMRRRNDVLILESDVRKKPYFPDFVEVVTDPQLHASQGDSR